MKCVDIKQEYKLKTPIGEGGFAVVYLAEHIKSHKLVAIKVTPVNSFNPNYALERRTHSIDMKRMKECNLEYRVYQEVGIHSKLQHANIVQVYDNFKDKATSNICLVMEYCEEGDLREHLKKYRPDEREVSEYIRQIVEGVSYLHERCIMHRDLKLANILLTKDRTVKIADFGLATRLLEETDKHRTMCGTPNYMSPEIASGGEHGPETDVFSIGCMLYHLLLLSPPFDAEDITSILTRVRREEPLIPTAGISSDARDLIKCLLLKDPRERIKISEIKNHAFFLGDLNSLNRSGSSSSVRTRDKSYDSGRDTIATSSSGGSQMSADSGFSPGFIPSNHRPATAARGRVSSREPIREGLRGREGLYKIIEQPPLVRDPGGKLLPPAECRIRQQRLQQRCQSATVGMIDSNDNIGLSSNARHSSQENLLSDSKPLHQSQQQHRQQQQQPQQQQMQDSRRRSVSMEGLNRAQAGSNASRDLVAVDIDLENGSGKGEGRNVGHEGQGDKIKVPPLSSARLRPFRQEASNAVVHILSDGTVCAEFFKTRGSDKCVNEVLRISSNGLDIEIYQPCGTPDRKECLLDPHRPPPVPVQSSSNRSYRRYSYYDLPGKYWKKYAYASRFVNLVRSKTPKITLYSSKAKCLLMENSPDADFEVYFYDGAKFSRSSTEFKITENDGTSMKLSANSSVHHVSLETQERYKLSAHLRDRCVKLEQLLTTFENDGLVSGGARESYFPLTIGRRPSLAPGSCDLKNSARSSNNSSSDASANQSPAFNSSTNHGSAFNSATNQSPTFDLTNNYNQSLNSTTNRSSAFNPVPAFSSTGTNQSPAFSSATNHSPAFSVDSFDTCSVASSRLESRLTRYDATPQKSSRGGSSSNNGMRYMERSYPPSSGDNNSRMEWPNTNSAPSSLRAGSQSDLSRPQTTPTSCQLVNLQAEGGAICVELEGVGRAIQLRNNEIHVHYTDQSCLAIVPSHSSSPLLYHHRDSQGHTVTFNDQSNSDIPPYIKRRLQAFPPIVSKLEKAALRTERHLTRSTSASSQLQMR